MKQIWVTKHGPPEVLQLQDGREPTPSNGEVRIRVEVTGVGFADALARMGLADTAPMTPFIPGFEVAGVVEAIGQGVPDLREGDDVFALTQYGGYSEVVCVPHKQVYRRLSWMSAEDGAALPFSYLTAYLMLVVMGSLRPGDRVLIHRAASSIGLATLDVCGIIGAETYGTASPDKHDFLLERGLRYPINYRSVDYEKAVQDLTGGRGVQLVLDALGGTHWQKNYRLLMPTGRLVHFDARSMATGQERSWLEWWRGMVTMPFYTPRRLMQENKGVIGVNLLTLWDYAELQREWMQQIVAWYDEALFRPHIDRCFSFQQAADAHRYVQERKGIGKILLAP